MCSCHPLAPPPGDASAPRCGCEDGVAPNHAIIITTDGTVAAAEFAAAVRAGIDADPGDWIVFEEATDFCEEAWERMLSAPPPGPELLAALKCDYRYIRGDASASDAPAPPRCT